MVLDQYNYVLLDDETNIKEFVCDDEDLKDFLLSKSKMYSSALLAKTYIFEDETNTVAYFSISNDTMRVEETDYASKSAFKRFVSSVVEHGKRHLKAFPAIKLGRLAVCDDLRGKGIGQEIISMVVGIALKQNDTCACKFVTVDAYDKSLGFYQKLGFSFLSDKDAGHDTRQMYMDITPLINSMNQSPD